MSAKTVFYFIPAILLQMCHLRLWRVCLIDLPPNTRKALQRRYNGVTRHSNNLKRAKKKPNPNTYFVVRFRLLLVEIRGFEPLTYTLRTYRATNCAISPKLRRIHGEVLFWWEQMGSNHRPFACQANALTN